jgi:hypothetical protein
MNGKSVGLIILWWSEVIISVRVLLFSIPVMISKYSAKSLSLSDPDSLFMAMITVTALVYFAVGIISISGYRFWRAAHYMAAALIILLTAGALYTTAQPPAGAGAHYFLPLLFSVIFTVLAGVLGGMKRGI